jgi:hypothetical protein
VTAQALWRCGAVPRLPRALLARRALPADVETDVTPLEGTRP